ncbi:hypothetical protein FNV43_RR19969 [Rhamnella rubrinervis]|uniref:Uncharacterized protein n=1 Tax=Rhamnella rubrinervis TaxID=2594499 RepID=A0A8K0GTS4_9ROSA|nr:hypothetical protein FNV43_RR19969 [Rhamnella rubrinervis]
MVDIKTQPFPQPKTIALSMRSGFEGLIRKHFGDEFDSDELFDLLSKKYEESFSTFDPKKAVTLFRNIVEAAKGLINKAISEKLEISNFVSSSNSLKTFRLADLGCSEGPNTFLAVQNIVDAVELKFKHHGLLGPQLPDFQILSRVPKEGEDKNSLAWNKGRIRYGNASNETFKAYGAQYLKDIESFLNARAHEVVHGDLMALIFPGCPNETLHSEIPVIKATELLGSCLMDLARKGVTSEEKVDTFNMPTFFPSMQQVEAAVKRNGCFIVEMVDIKTQPLPQPKTLALSTVFRSGFEGVIRKHFGDSLI